MTTTIQRQPPPLKLGNVKRKPPRTDLRAEFSRSSKPIDTDKELTEGFRDALFNGTTTATKRSHVARAFEYDKFNQVLAG
ncbi:hypothetical protein JJC00_17475 [Bradyrhizobium diazoefficiens]|uniref:hypothetical protein n=1 Tax=Bradyrhizobium diazoefficiens TaxID=1355477 RepID=UPI00190CA4D9|nr:hypothetical protein [Bradyrhizobium diazoefficiens]QQO37233.1 hypothetical protein JJC00_17475 [Bradyrhizobium diazoefficiens]